MPRELYLVTPQPVAIEPLLRAAASIDGDLAIRSLMEGNVLQLVDLDDVAVLSLGLSRLIADPLEVGRVAPGLALVERSGPDGELWWSEGTAPWGDAGDVGVQIARALAVEFGGSLRVEDGR